MKKIIALLALTVLSLRADDLWERYEKAIDLDQPKTAVKVLKDISADALEAKNWDVVLLTLGKVAVLESIVDQDEKHYATLTRLDALEKTAPAEVKPLLEALSLERYWMYFQSNRYKFASRTAVSTADEGENIDAWSLLRILKEIDGRFARLLSDPGTLARYPANQFPKTFPPKNSNTLNDETALSDIYRPTLYDIIAHRAIEFYSAPECSLGGDEFKEKALDVFNAVAAWHERQGNALPHANICLERLQFECAQREATASDKEAEAKKTFASLRAFADNNRGSEISARALAALAQKLFEQKKYVEAIEAAERGMNAYPKSVGAKECYTVIQNVKLPSFSLRYRDTWALTKPEAQPYGTIHITARNAPKIYFRLYATTIDLSDTDGSWRWRWLSREQAEKLCEQVPAQTFEANLPPSATYDEVKLNYTLPKPVKGGTYYLVASLKDDAEWSNRNTGNIVDCRCIQVSDLAMDVSQISQIGSELVARVFEADSGKPVPDTPITFFYTLRDTNKRDIQAEQLQTDSLGQARFDLTGKIVHTVRARQDEDAIVWWPGYSFSYGRPGEPEPKKILLLTDRAIYRPGQTVQYKGIYYTTDAATGTYEIRPNANYTIRLRDSNGQEIGAHKEQANAFGSFSGSFVIPEGRGTGRFRLTMDHGSTDFSVEEYKRPKFEVIVDPPKAEYKLGEEAQFTGRAQSYAGLPATHAKVKWSIQRRTSYPWWCWWYYRNPTPNKVIAQGETQTDEQGNYTLTFKAEAPENAKPTDEPTFTFTARIDVVDTTGETRSASQSITLGFTALRVNINPPSWIEAGQPAKIDIFTRNLNGNPIPGEGELLVHQLQPPKRPTPTSIAANEEKDPNQPLNWPIGKMLLKLPFKSDATGNTMVEAALPAGVYLLEVQAKDKFGAAVTSKSVATVTDLAAKKSAVGVGAILECEKNTVEPGETFRAVWGSGYPTAYCQAELYRDGKLLKRWMNKPEDTQLVVEYPITEDLRGGCMLRTLMVREGEKYEQSTFINVPWSNKQLKLEWRHMRSKLEPGDKEKWLLLVKRPDGSPATAEVIGCMYDASLDSFISSYWPSFTGFASGYEYWRSVFTSEDSRSIYSKTLPRESWDMPWRIWDRELTQWYHWSFGGIMKSAVRMKNVYDSSSPAMRGARMSYGGGDEVVLYEVSADAAGVLASSAVGEVWARKADKARSKMEEAGKEPVVNIRRNLSETAFFLPHQETDVDGNAVFAFTAPEALTGWKVRVLAHERDLSSGYLEAETVTQRRLMLEPNFPRFLREGDVIELPVKLTNTSETNQAGQVSLVLRDGRSGAVNTALFVAEGAEQAFTLKPGESKAFSWKVKVPEQAAGLLQYTLMAKGTDCGDGEEAFLPVLSKRIALTESLAFTVRPNQDKTFEMKRLLNMAELKGIENINLKLEVTPNAVWSAVLALPYLMEYPHECAEQLFHRYYANTLARHILQQNPKIEEVFKRWQALNEGTLKSPLEKNQELKRLLIEETPWLKSALKESEQRRDIALLFDKDRAERERKQIIARLRVMRNNSGLWPWFAGGPENHWVSLKIVTGVGHLRKLGVKDIDLELIRNAVVQLDNRCYNRVKAAKDNKEPLSAGTDDVNYLYARTFFMEEIKLSDLNEPALREMLKAAAEGWQKFPLYTRAQLAIALFRLGDADTAKLICKSMQENAVESEELGMYWKLTRSWWWYEAPIETQAMVMEAFREVTQDQKLVDECALWLLQQKRTSRWPTTVSTAHAVYAILLSSNAPLTDSAAVQVKLGGDLIEPAKAEPGSGYFSESFAKDKIKPELGRIEVSNPHSRIVFGGLHWQYLQDIGEVTASDDALPLRIKRELFKREVTAVGSVLKPLDVALQQGDTVVTRIELRVDRDMEFVHLKDTRAASLEPVDVLSSYRWQDGVGYFQSTRDTATHFFFDRLPRGTYVFEYDCNVFQNGTCNAGLAEVQCMYAPEFNAHSQGRSIQSGKAR